MSKSLIHSMQNAFKLVKSGQLHEANAALQQALTGKAVPTNPIKPSVTPHPKAAEILTKLQEQLANFKQDLPLPTGKPAPTILVPDGAQYLHKTYSSAFGSRDYSLYIPSSYKGQAMPLVVMLHGCTQSADDFAAGTQMNALGEEFGCLVAYPNQSMEANPNHCWNWFKPQDQSRAQGEPALIAGLTQQIGQDYRVDTKRVYVAGLSAGAAMASIMAATYPDVYAAVGIHSGLPAGSANTMPAALMAMNQGCKVMSTPEHFVPTIVFHGDQDYTVNQLNAEQVVAQAQTPLQQQQTCHTETSTQRPANQHAYTRTVTSDAKGQAQLEYWLIHGAGHAWAGGSRQGTYTDPQGPNASREMLRFFLAHPH